jgi:hypothetical protein
LRDGFHDFFDIAPELVAAGYVGVMTDAEGLGTPGIHPYLMGPSEFQAIISSGALLPGARGFIWQLALGFEASYAELSIEDVFAADALSAIETLLDEEACGAEFGEVAGGFDRIFEGYGHNDSTQKNMPLMLEWTAARFAGESAVTTCE